MKITIGVVLYCYNLKQKKLVIAPVLIKFNVSYFIGIRFTAGRTPSPFAPLLLLVCNIQNGILECKITAPILDLISVTIIKIITTDLHFPLFGQSGATWFGDRHPGTLQTCLKRQCTCSGPCCENGKGGSCPIMQCFERSCYGKSTYLGGRKCNDI